jgi:hypothetical protein
MHNLQRVGKLLLLVLLVGLLFYPISYFYPDLNWRFDLRHVLYTFTGFHPYNAEWWFLLPWMILCLGSKLIFRVFEAWPKRLLAVSLVGYFVVRLIIWKYGDTLVCEPYRYLYEVMTTVWLMMPFLLGAAFARYGWLYRCSRLCNARYALLVTAFLIVLWVRVFFLSIGIADPFIAVLLCTVATKVQSVALSKLGGVVRGCGYAILSFVRTISQPSFMA